MQRDLTQQYAHYYQKWQQEQKHIANAQRVLDNGATNKVWWTRELRLANRRATYANKRMCDVEAQNIREGGQIGSLTWQAMWHNEGHFKAVQDGYIIPATPSMHQG